MLQEVLLLLLGGVVAAALRLVYYQALWWWRYRDSGLPYTGKVIPGLGDVTIIPMAKLRSLHRLQESLRLKTQHALIWTFLVPAQNLMLVVDPADVKYMLKDGFANFEKGKTFRNMLVELLGDGIFTTDGPAWKRQRKLASHLFTGLKNEYQFHVFTKHARAITDLHIGPALRDGTVLDMQDIFLRFTLDSIGEIAFGRNINSLSKDVPFSKAFNVVQDLMVARIFSNPIRRYFMTQEINKHVKVLNAFAHTIIREKREALAAGRLRKEDDLIARHLLTDPKVTDVELRDELAAFLIAGRDTTGVTLTWATYLLSQNPDVERKLVEEIRRVIPNIKEEYPTRQNLRDMPYLQGLVKETLRLYPPVHSDSKYCVKKCTLPSGVVVHEGTVFQWSAYTMGRHPDFWDDVDSFKPERWVGVANVDVRLGRGDDNPATAAAAADAADAASKGGSTGVDHHEAMAEAEAEATAEAPNNPLKVHPWQWLPFQGGPRTCLGINLAQQEAAFLLATLWGRYCFEYQGTVPAPENHGIVLFAAEPMAMKISVRE